MYYIHNVNQLGEKIAVAYTNKYINWLNLGCKYSDQEQVNALCPLFIKETSSIPDFFINMIKNVY